MRPFYKVYLMIFLLISAILFASDKSEESLVEKTKNIIWQDYVHFYSPPNLRYTFGGIFISGIFANTSFDGRIRNWFQESVRNDPTDQFSKVVKPIGNTYEPLSIYAGITLLGRLTKHTTIGSVVYEWGSNSLRAIIVGAPAVGVLQFTLGASRPNEGGSGWRPFHDNNAVSGHAFMGAIPFLTISRMIEPVYFKTLFYIGSTATAISRINDNKHYFSQTLAGWWIAYLAVNSLNIEKDGKVELHPSFLPNGWKMELCLSF